MTPMTPEPRSGAVPAGMPLTEDVKRSSLGEGHPGWHGGPHEAGPRQALTADSATPGSTVPSRQ